MQEKERETGKSRASGGQSVQVYKRTNDCGPPLGRPKLEADAQTKKIGRRDDAERNVIEGKFGEGKHTSEVSIHLLFLVMNLRRHLRLLFSFLLETLLSTLILQLFSPDLHAVCFS